MNDFSPNSLLDFFCIISVAFVALYNYMRMKAGKKGTGYIFFVFFILLFSLFYRPVNGDFWHYLEMYDLGSGVHNHLEPYFNWLIEEIPNNFLLWRIAIWLPAAILIAFTYQKLGIQSSMATFFFCLLGLVGFYYYTRNVLGMSILIFALSLISSRRLRPSTKIIHTILIIGLFALSWYLHKSMPIFIALSIMAILLPPNKRILLYSLLMFPILYGAIYSISSSVLGLELWLNESSGEEYLEAANTFYSNWKGVLGLIIKYAPIVYFYVIGFNSQLLSDKEEKSYKMFLYLSFFIFYISFLFFGRGSIMLQLRLYNSSLLPLSFASSIYFRRCKEPRQLQLFIVLLLVSYMFSLLYSLV